MPDYTPLSFVGQDTDPKTRIALSMVQNGMDTTPIRSWTQGANRALQSIFGAMMLKDQQSSQKDATAAIVNSLMGGGGATPDAGGTPPAAPATPSIPPQAMSGSPMADTAAPLSGGTLAQGPTATDSTLPRGLRNNNPLNIESGGFTQSQPGYQGSDGRFAQFASTDQGLGAADNLLQSYAGKGINTINGIVSRWAPPSDGNPTSAYAATVAKQVGVDPNAPLDMSNPAIRQKIVGAMAQFENGRPLPATAALTSGPSPSVMSPSPMSAQPMAFNGQPPSANPLANGPPQASAQPILQPPMPQANPLTAQAQAGGMSPPPAGPAPNITNVPTAPAQLPIGGGQAPQQGKPILAPPQRANPQIPDNVRQAIITAVNSPDPNARAMGMAMLQKYTAPQSYGFQTAGDGTILRTNPQTGAVEPVYQTSKPQFTTIGTDQFGNPIHGFVDPTNQKVTPAGVTQGQQIGAGGLPAQGGVPGQDLPTGDAFLSTQPKPVADQVKALAEGRMQFPAGFALKSPYWQHMIQMVSQYDPSFDAINYGARAKTRADFTSGKSAQSVNAMNTVIGHLQSLSDAGDKLNNSSFTPANAVVNKAETLMGDPRYTQFDTTKKAVVDELTRVWRGGGGSEGDIKTWSEQINNANSPQQLHGVIHQIGDLLESKMNAMGEQYRQGMGTSKTPIQLITPQSQKVLDVLRQRAGGAPTEAAPQAASAPQAAPQGQPMTKTIGGKTYINQGGQWYQQ